MTPEPPGTFACPACGCDVSVHDHSVGCVICLPGHCGITRAGVYHHHLTTTRAALRAAEAERDAWRELAEHLEGCVTCGETSTNDCWEGARLKAAALDASTNYPAAVPRPEGETP